MSRLDDFIVRMQRTAGYDTTLDSILAMHFLELAEAIKEEIKELKITT